MICVATITIAHQRHELVERQQVPERFVVIRIGQPPREADHAQDVHREEHAVQEDERQQEVNLARASRSSCRPNIFGNQK